MALSDDTGEGSPPATEPGTTLSARAHDPYAALRYRDFRALIAGSFLSTLGQQMLTVGIGWDIYVRTQNALMLGFVGLAQFLPVLAFSLVAGHSADRYDRRVLSGVTQTEIALTSLGLLAIALTHGPVWVIFVLLALRGVGEAFNTAAWGALPPQTTPVVVYENAASWSSSSWQLAAVLGPALAGLVIAARGDASLVYLFDALAGAAFIVAVSQIRGKQATRNSEPMTVAGLMGGVRFIFQTRVILGAITLDMVAVLLGGATTLLPIYATKILHVGPQGLGLMASAPSVGAVLMAMLQAHRPPFKHAGRALLLAVGVYGVATLVFGVSTFFPLSLAALLVLGAMDNISVVIRKTLLLLRTPDELRGRLSAVNNVFVGTSNQLGGFESGAVAAAIGPVTSVALGGIGSVLAVLGIAWAWPELRQLGRMTAVENDPAASEVATR
ncbi:MAG TPA: MFS transporter [Ktedonobacterales bacterium]